jgi:hypothetical protein
VKDIPLIVTRSVAAQLDEGPFLQIWLLLDDAQGFGGYEIWRDNHLLLTDTLFRGFSKYRASIYDFDVSHWASESLDDPRYRVVEVQALLDKGWLDPVSMPGQHL